MNRTTARVPAAVALVGATLAPLPAQHAGPAPAPRLVVERLGADLAEPWRPGSRLVLAVELSHPCMTGAPLEQDFVLDPDGGFAKAMDLVVTDAEGRVVPLSFTRHGGSDAGALTLSRFARRTVWFELEPQQQTVRIDSDRLQIVARLHATSGAWQGTATSKPVSLEVATPVAPELTLLADTTLYRGWPALVAVTIRVPDEGETVLLPTRPDEWTTALRLALQTEGGVAVPDVCSQIPVDHRVRGRLEPGGTHTVRFRIPAAATASLAEGRYRWTATFRAAAPATGDPAPGPVFGGVIEAVRPCACANAPDPLPTELASERERRLARADLAEALALRAEAERPVGYLHDRRRVAEHMAKSFVAAERRALALLRQHPGDEAACLLLVEILAAADDPVRARLFAGRAVAIEFERRRASAAGGDGAQEEPSLALACHAEALAASGRPLDPDIASAFHTALAALRRGEGGSADAPTATPSPSVPTGIATDAPTASPGDAPTTVAGTATHGTAATLDARFAADANGQWAASALASSQYDTDGYSAARATGAPDVPQHGDHANAWAPGTAEGGVERLTLSFSRPTRATEVRVRQSCNPGAITRVLLSGAGGERVIVFDGADPASYEPDTIGWFVVAFPRTAFAVAKVELTCDTKQVTGWNEIDAVQLVGDPAPR